MKELIRISERFEELNSVVLRLRDLIYTVVDNCGGMLLTECSKDQDSIYINYYNTDFILQQLMCKGICVKNGEIFVCLDTENTIYTKGDLETAQWYDIKSECEYYNAIINIAEVIDQYINK